MGAVSISAGGAIEWEKKMVDLSSGTQVVANGPCLVKGVYINTETSKHEIKIKDGSEISYRVPKSAPQGHAYKFSDDGSGVKFTTSVVVDPSFFASGNITVLFKRQF